VIFQTKTNHTSEKNNKMAWSGGKATKRPLSGDESETMTSGGEREGERREGGRGREAEEGGETVVAAVVV
jgi:hypothetical protein